MAGNYTFHGVRATQQQVAHEEIRECRSGIPFVVGTAPVQAGKGKVNTPVRCDSFDDAVEQFGYSEDWDKYTLCQAMYSQFKLYGSGPVVFVNVLDPAVMKEAVNPAAFAVSEDHVAELPYEAILDSVTVSVDDDSAVETIGAVNSVIAGTVGQKSGLKGCTVAFSEKSRTLRFTLTGTPDKIKNTGVFDALTALTADGYTVSIEGNVISALADFTATEAYTALMAMTEGCADVKFSAVAAKSGSAEVTYTVVASYPAAGAELAAAEEETAAVPQSVLTAGTDYQAVYDTDSGSLLIELLPGSVAYEAETVTIGYDQVTPESVTKRDIIGGKDAVTHEVKGFEVLEYVYHMVGLAPDLLLCPKWSRDPEVALVMAAKAEDIGCVFRGLALADVDTAACPVMEDLEGYKAQNGLKDPNLVLFWPMVKYAGKTYDLSVAAAGVIAATDAEEGNVPCASPSNRTILADAAVTADGAEIMLNVNEASRINHLGIVTVLTKFVEGNTLYGDKTSGWPEGSDPQNGDIAGNRMFDYVCNNLIQKTWAKVDKRLTRRLVQSVVDEINRWLNGMAADEKILGGRVEFLQSENTTEQISQGLIRYHVYLGTAPTGRSVEYIVEQDLSYLESAIAELAS